MLEKVHYVSVHIQHVSADQHQEASASAHLHLHLIQLHLGPIHQIMVRIQEEGTSRTIPPDRLVDVAYPAGRPFEAELPPYHRSSFRCRRVTPMGLHHCL